MKLYKLYQTVNNNWDTYDSVVVAAMSIAEAKMIHPENIEWNGEYQKWDSWCAVEDVKAEYLGTAKPGTKKGVVLGSFNAG